MYNTWPPKLFFQFVISFHIFRDIWSGLFQPFVYAISYFSNLEEYLMAWKRKWQQGREKHLRGVHSAFPWLSCSRWAICEDAISAPRLRSSTHSSPASGFCAATEALLVAQALFFPVSTPVSVKTFSTIASELWLQLRVLISCQWCHSHGYFKSTVLSVFLFLMYCRNSIPWQQ